MHLIMSDCTVAPMRWYEKDQTWPGKFYQKDQQVT